MPKIDPNYFKNYVAKLREERYGKQYGRQASSSTDLHVGKLVTDIYQAADRALRTINKIRQEMPSIQLGVAEIFCYAETPNEKALWNAGFLTRFMKSLKNVCTLLENQISTDRDKIKKIFEFSLACSIKDEVRINKRLYRLKRETFPLTDKFADLVTFLSSTLNYTLENNNEHQVVEKSGLLFIEFTINKLREDLQKKKNAPSF